MMMKKKMINAYLISTQTCKALEIKNDLEEFYKLVDCGCIDIVERKIGNKIYDIVCDDEGLLKMNSNPSMIDKKGNIMLVGNLLICHHDEDGNLTSLEKGDVENIENNIIPVLHRGRYLRIVRGEYE